MANSAGAAPQQLMYYYVAVPGPGGPGQQYGVQGQEGMSAAQFDGSQQAVQMGMQPAMMAPAGQAGGLMPGQMRLVMQPQQQQAPALDGSQGGPDGQGGQGWGAPLQPQQGGHDPQGAQHSSATGRTPQTTGSSAFKIINPYTGHGVGYSQGGPWRDMGSASADGRGMDAHPVGPGGPPMQQQPVQMPGGMQPVPPVWTQQHLPSQQERRVPALIMEAKFERPGAGGCAPAGQLCRGARARPTPEQPRAEAEEEEESTAGSSASPQGHPAAEEDTGFEQWCAKRGAAQRKAEEEAKKLADEAAQRKAEEEAKNKLADEEDPLFEQPFAKPWAAQRKAEEEAKNKLADEDAKRTLEDWLLQAAQIDRRSLEKTMQVCTTLDIFSVQDLGVFDKPDLLELFGKMPVVALRIWKALRGEAGSAIERADRSPGRVPTTSSGSAERMPPQKYSRIKELGQGSFGRTYLVESGGRQFAMKSSKGQKVEDARALLREAFNMAQLQHERLVCIVEPYLENDTCGLLQVHIVMEYCAGGDLHARIGAGPALLADEVCSISACVADALRFLHAQGPPVVHRDVKPANILLSIAEGRPPLAKLADFGLARRLGGSTLTLTAAGTLSYMPPDAFEVASASADVWALGRVAVEMASGRAAEKMTTSQEHVEDLCSSIPAGFPVDFEDVLRRALSLNRQVRPTAEELTNHTAFKDFLPSPARGAEMAPSMDQLMAQLSRARWMAPSAVQGLGWEQTHTVKVCKFDPGSCTSSEREAHRLLLGLVRGASSNEAFAVEGRRVCETVLCRDHARACQFLARCRDLSQKYKDKHLYSLEAKLGDVSSPAGRWRRKVLEYFQRYPTLCTEAYACNVRVWVGFHAAPSKDVAMAILQGGFARLQALDPGYIGDGIYLSLDAEYAVAEYGKTDEVPLLVCAVVVGNAFPVIENCKTDAEHYLGKALVSKADAHVAVMARDPWANKGCPDPLPCRPECWEDLEKNTEVVLNEAQVLPLGVLVVR